MAPSYERAHTELFSKGESLMIVVFSLPSGRRIFVSGDLSKHPESISLVSLFFGLTGEFNGTLGMLNCAIHSVPPQIALAEARSIERNVRLCAALTYSLL
jgi:hypothetical protein